MVNTAWWASGWKEHEGTGFHESWPRHWCPCLRSVPVWGSVCGQGRAPPCPVGSQVGGRGAAGGSLGLVECYAWVLQQRLLEAPCSSKVTTIEGARPPGVCAERSACSLNPVKSSHREPQIMSINRGCHFTRS